MPFWQETSVRSFRTSAKIIWDKTILNILFQIYPSVIINEQVSSKRYMLASAPIKDSGRFRGGFWGSLELPFETKLFHFHGKFQKNQERIINFQVKLTNGTPCGNLNPLSRNPGSAAGRLRSAYASVQSDQSSMGSQGSNVSSGRKLRL